MKQEIIRTECGVKQCNPAKKFGFSKNTICTILAKKDAIKSAMVAKGVSKLFYDKHRSLIHEEIERLLMIWIKDRQVKGDISTQFIRHKAKVMYEDLKKNAPGTSSSKNEKEEFKARSGWFFKFKKRTN